MWKQKSSLDDGDKSMSVGIVCPIAILAACAPDAQIGWDQVNDLDFFVR